MASNSKRIDNALMEEMNRLYSEHEEKLIGNFMICYYIIDEYLKYHNKKSVRIDIIKKIALKLMNEGEFDDVIYSFSESDTEKEWIKNANLPYVPKPIEIEYGKLRIHYGFNFHGEFEDGWKNIPNIMELAYPRITKYIKEIIESR